MSRRSAAVAFGGGLALGAYHLGVVEALTESIDIQAVAGSSIGAVTAAILASDPDHGGTERLRSFWEQAGAHRWETHPLFGLPPPGMVRHVTSWLNALGTRLGGAPALFRPGLEPGAWLTAGASFYEPDPLRRTLTPLIDFDLLNNGGMRCCLAATDVETAELVLFDTAAGDALTMDHILASGALLPDLPPVRIGDRLLADGGLAANVPFEPLLRGEHVSDLLIIADLFAPDGDPPRSIEAAAARASELQFAAQTRLRLEAFSRERSLQTQLAPNMAGIDVLWLSYRAPRHEAGPERPFDFSSSTLADRRAAGARDTRAALEQLAVLPPLSAGEFRITQVRAKGGPTL